MAHRLLNGQNPGWKAGLTDEQVKKAEKVYRVALPQYLLARNFSNRIKATYAIQT